MIFDLVMFLFQDLWKQESHLCLQTVHYWNQTQTPNIEIIFLMDQFHILEKIFKMDHCILKRLHARFVIQCKDLLSKNYDSQRVNANNEAYIKRRDKIKNRIASQRINISNYKPNVQDTKISTSQVRNKRTTRSTKIVPTFEATQQRRSVPLKGAFKINEWTEKLLEEARYKSFSFINVSSS